MPPRPPHERHLPSSAVSGFIDRARIDALLEPWIPDPADRAFVTRCIVSEGPAHHRGANYVLLRLLGEALAKLPPTAGAAPGEALAVPMKLPPHLAAEGEAAKTYPLRLPTAALEALAPRPSRELDAMVDCLTDGPPQHALANVAMVALLTELLARLEAGGPR